VRISVVQQHAYDDDDAVYLQLIIGGVSRGMTTWSGLFGVRGA
jgi:hypothetical protein